MNKGYYDYAKYGSIGISWVLSTSIYLYLGYKGGAYLDSEFGSAPIFLLIGLLMGIGLSLRTLISEVLALTGAAGSDKNRGNGRAPDREKSNNSGGQDEH